MNKVVRGGNGGGGHYSLAGSKAALAWGSRGRKVVVTKGCEGWEWRRQPPSTGSVGGSGPDEGLQLFECMSQADTTLAPLPPSPPTPPPFHL